MTQVASSYGAVCLRHRRWIYQGDEVDLGGRPAHLSAERHFRGCLRSRGVALETGELQLATSLLTGWPSGRADEAFRRGAEAASLFAIYPQAVILSRVIAEIVGNPLSDATMSSLWDTVYIGRRAIAAAFGMQGARKKCAQQRALCAAAYTHRACLLRHLDAKLERPARGDFPAARVPAASVVVRRQHPWTQ